MEGSLAREINKQMGLNAFQKLWTNLRWIPVSIDIEMTARKAAKNSEAMHELKKKCFGEDIPEEKLTPKETEKAAKEMHDEVDSAKVSTTIVKAAEEINDVLLQQRIIERGINTQKLLNYAYFYMVNDKASLIKRPRVEQEIINSVAQIFGFPKIYDSAGYAPLKQYDMEYPDEFLETAKFILSISDIKRKLKDTSFMEQIKDRLETMKAEGEFPQDDQPDVIDGNITEVKDNNVTSFWKLQDDPKIVKPLTFHNLSGNNGTGFDYTKMVDSLPVRGAGIEDDLFEMLESTVGKICPYKYRYELYGQYKHLVRMLVNRGSGIEDGYIIDPGVVMGCGKVYVMAYIRNNDTLFVSAEYEEILKKVFSNPYYVLTEEEVQSVVQKYFRNMRNYKYIDMSMTEELGELGDDDFQKLGKKLTFILNQVAQQSSGSELPRFRFNYWKSIDDFSIISDTAVISPMSYDNTTSPVICDGLLFEVKGDDVTEKYLGNTIVFHIDKYGDM